MTARYNIKYIITALLLIVFQASDIFAADGTFSRADSTRFEKTHAYEILHVGLPLVATGACMIPLRTEFQEMRHFSFEGFRHSYDDFLQYSPAAATILLKACGVESRHSWGRMLTADAIGFATMTVLVNAGKYSARQLRPDHSTRNSFPSGHTATAFAAATMLHKEYGEASPWYSIAGYGAATITGISRILNNRHWISDVIAGAGIGIISMELGYYLTGLIFKDRGISNNYLSNGLGDRYDDLIFEHNPSFIGTSGGYMIILNKGCTDGVRTEKGVMATVEGAGFFNSHIGIGGAISYGNMTVSHEDKGTAIYENIFPISISTGIYGSCQMPWKRFSIDGKFLCGYTQYRSYNTLTSGRFDRNDGISLTAGFGLGFRSTAFLKSRAFVNWNYLPQMAAGGRGIHSICVGAGIYLTIASLK